LKKVTRRSPNEHLSFGDGIHFCLDAASARIQGRVAITMLLERFARLGFCRSRTPSGFQGQHDGARGKPVRKPSDSNAGGA
jgi:cytochrome P450